MVSWDHRRGRTDERRSKERLLATTLSEFWGHKLYGRGREVHLWQIAPEAVARLFPSLRKTEKGGGNAGVFALVTGSVQTVGRAFTARLARRKAAPYFAVITG